MKVDIFFQAKQSRLPTGRTIATRETDSSIPVAKNVANGFQTGILTERQKLWTIAKPNDRSIENPVLKKYVLS